MDISSIDNYVWENYNTEMTSESFKAWLYDKHTISGWVWMHTLREHAHVKEEEHQRIHAKLCIFKNSLPSPLRDCVDPFLDQQAKLCNSYQAIRRYYESKLYGK